MIRRALPALLCVLASLAAASGCGIRATSVPVDGGAAPSRVGCVLPNDRKSPDGGGGTSVVRVYLVCGSRVSPVERAVRMPGGRSWAERLPVARKLLDELKQDPRAVEDTAGFETAVPRELTISKGTGGDPDEALRLSEPLDELPPYTLAQIVCTYADTSAADAEGGVVLGGPAGSGSGPPLRRYECGTTLRNHPQSAETAGTRLVKGAPRRDAGPLPAPPPGASPASGHARPATTHRQTGDDASPRDGHRTVARNTHVTYL